MDRTTLLRLWDESWTEGIWIAPWSKALADLSAKQAAWKPMPGGGRHSIWQIVNHVAVWREYTLTKVDGRPGPTRQDMDKLNFEEPGQATEAAWDTSRRRLETSHRNIREAIANPASPMERLLYHLPHDAYHLGQIMQLRAMQGMPPIE